MKIIVFGIGEIYGKVKHYFYKEKDKIVALVDNNPGLLGRLVDGYALENPSNIQHYQYDYVVITSNYAIEMRQQLIGLGVQTSKIIHYRDYIGNLPVEIPGSKTDMSVPSVLILSNGWGYHGGPITSMNLARILSQRGYKITIAVPEAEQKFLEEISSEENIKVIIVENLGFLSKENLEWTKGYTYIWANTLVMARCAVKLAHKRKVYLWLHESIDTYIGYEYWHDEMEREISNKHLLIGAVSDVARNNFFNTYHIEKRIDLLPYGINDKYKGNAVCVKKENTTFAIITPHISIKGVDVLIEALPFISKEAENQCKFLFVGKSYDDEYGKYIMKQIEKNANCEYIGELSRKKLLEVYSEIDIVIIPSRRDSMSLVATEAMMMKRPCIVSDTIGMAGFIKHKYNGLIFENENGEELAERICWCLENKDALKVIAENARKTYEEHFTMQKFEDNVMDVMQLLSSV